MNKLIISLVIIALVLMSSLVVFDKYIKQKDITFTADEDNDILNGVNYNSLSYNGQPLTDHTMFTPEEIAESNTILGGNGGMYAMVRPAIIEDLDGQDLETLIEFGYDGIQTRNISLILVFEGELEKGRALLKKNITEQIEIVDTENAWISNRAVDFDSYTDLGTPDIRCEIGNQNNTRMFSVVLDGVTSIYCFTNQQVQDSDTVLLSGNYNKVIKTYKNISENRFVNVGNRFEYMGNNLLGNGFDFYRAENLQFKTNDVYDLKLVFTPKDKDKSGKWHIFMYETEYGLIDSINDERYMYIDPWWNSSWDYKKNVTNLTGNIITLRIPYNANMNADFSDLRFLNPAEASEYPYALIQVNATTATYKVQTNGSTSLMMYYGNTGASYTGSIASVYPANLTYAFFFDDGYNESVTGVNGFAVVSGYTTPLQNESYVTYNQNGSSGTGGIFGLTPSSPAEYTYVANAYPTSYTQGTISGFKDASYANKHFVFRNDGGVQGIQHIVGAGPSTNTFARLTAPLNTWHYVVGQAKAGTGNRVYVDGNTSVNTGALSAIGTSASVLDVATARNGANATYESFAGQIDYWLYFTRFLDVNEVGYLKEQTAPYAIYGTEQSSAVDNIPNITLINPADHKVENMTLITYFGANLTDDQLVDNYTFYLWYQNGTLVDTDFYDVNSATQIINNSKTLTNGTYTWNIYAYDNASQLGMGTNRSLNVSVADTPLSLLINLVRPTDDKITNIINQTFWSYPTILNGNATNTTYFIYNSSNDLYSSGFINNLSNNGNTSILIADNDTNTDTLGSGVTVGVIIYMNEDLVIRKYGLMGRISGTMNTVQIKDIDGNLLTTLNNAIDDSRNVTSEYRLYNNTRYRIEAVNSNLGVLYYNATAYQNLPMNINNKFVIENLSINGANITTNTRWYFPYSLEYSQELLLDNLLSDTYHWNTYTCAENATSYLCAYASDNYTLTIDTIDPTLNIIYPTTSIDNESIVGRNISLNYSITDTNLQACGYQYNNINYTVNCNLNSSFVYVEDVDSIILWVNDSAGNYNSTSRSFTFNDSVPDITIIHPLTLQGEGIAGQNMSLNYTITDANLESCWYEYNNANYTVNCNLNSSFTYVSGVNSIKLWANDTANNINSETRAFTFTYVTNEAGYNSPVYETSNQTFTYNITYNNSYYDLITAKLFYDGDDYSATQIGSGNPAFFTKTIDVPAVNGIENKSFYWQITLINSSETVQFTSLTYNQTIEDINMSFCSTGTNTTANFTVYNELDLTQINPHNFSATFNYWLGSGTTYENVSVDNVNVNQTRLCIFDNDETYYANAIIEYAATEYTKRNYYFDNKAFNNITQEFYLYLQESDELTSFIIEVKDQSLNPVTDALVYIQRYYPGTDSYTTVQIAQTDDNGETIGFYKTETVDYRHIIIKDGVTLLTTGKQKIVPKSTPYTLTFIVGSADDIPWEDLEENESITTTLVFNKTTNITTFTYLDETESIGYGRLLIVQENDGNSTIVTICDTNSTDTSASLVCTITSTGRFKAYAYIDGQIVKIIEFSILTARDIFGNEGVFIAIFIIMVAGFAMIWNPSAGIIGINAALIFTNLVGLISVSPVFIFGSIAVSIIALMLLKT